MKSLTPQTIPNVTPERIAYIRQQGQVRGIDLKQNVGDFKYDHCVVHYEFDPAKQTLVLAPQVPFFVTENEFWDAVHAELGTGPAPTPTPAAALVTVAEVAPVEKESTPSPK